MGALSDVLLSLGATCCTVEDADLGTDDELELYAGDEKVWHRCDVTAMFAPGEDVDAVGLSILSGAHLALTSKVIELLREQGAGDIPVLVGGLIPEQDKDALRELGVAGVFTAGTPISEVAEFITSHVAAA